jgi:hypothetical protein
MTELDAIQNLNNFADLVHFKNKYEGKELIWILDIYKENDDIHAMPIETYYTVAKTSDEAKSKFKPYFKNEYQFHATSKIRIPTIPKVI